MNESKDEMIDTLQTIGNGSLIHHGKSNNRIYLMKLAQTDHEQIVKLLQDIAHHHNYSKIICKVPTTTAPLFIASGFTIEGYIPSFYKGKEDALFLSLILKAERAQSVAEPAMQQLFRLMQSPSTPLPSSTVANSPYTIRQLDKADTLAMSQIYSLVFKSYPFPIHNPAYLDRTMDENIQYFGAFKADQLVALASSEMDVENMNAEMTDFATHPLHTGHSLSRLLLAYMEQRMKKQGIKTLYTIARLNSIPMNKTFLNAGYSYSGTLLNNTQIAGTIESMNLYYKQM